MNVKTMFSDDSAAAGIRSLADYVARLGKVPLERIRYRPFPGTATEADLREAAKTDGYYCELVDGTLVEKPVGYRESLLAAALIEYLRRFVKPRKLGLVSGEQGMMRLEPGLVRGPDVAFVRWKRGRRRVPREAFPSVSPTLAVEILSRSNTRREMNRKRREYFRSGTELVWEIDPRKRRVRVYASPNDFVELTAKDVLDGGTALPGFSISLSEFFGELDDEDSPDTNGNLD